MDPEVSFFQRVWNRLRGTTVEALVRNLELTFYGFYFVLMIACIILPYELGKHVGPFFALSAFSFIFGVMFNYLRYKIHLYFHVLVNSGVILTVVSAILFEIGMVIVASILMTIGLLAVAIFIISAVLGYKVIAANEALELNQLEMANREPNQPQPEVIAQDDQQGQDNEPPPEVIAENDQQGQDNEPPPEVIAENDQQGQDEPQPVVIAENDQQGQDNEPQEANVQANLDHGQLHQLVLPNGQVVQLAPHIANGHVEQIERGQ